MRRTLLVLACAFLPLQVFAEDAPISRRDGFLEIWQTLKRPAEYTSRASYSDLQQGDAGSTEILYAKLRGILDEDDAFRPDDPLTLGDALVWLLRTRNITRDPNDVRLDTLGVHLPRYPIAADPTPDQAREAISRETLMRLTNSLDQKLRDEVHEVSLYGEKWQGKGTAFGETFDMHELSAAHLTLPHNTLVKVTNVANGKSVIVRINDRGPFIEGRDMDLSLAAFLQIEERSKGILRATFERLGDVSLVDPAPAQQPKAEEPTTDAITCRPLDPPYTARLARGVVLEPGIPSTAYTGSPVSFHVGVPIRVLGVRKPDGNAMRINKHLAAGESHTFTPTDSGAHVFILRLESGQRKAVRMNAITCAS